jgi:TP901 family phage tail tape measure protein
MAEDNVKIVLSAEDRASAVVQGFMREITRLQNMVKGLKLDPMKGSGLDNGSKVRDNFTKGQAEAMRGLNQRFAFEGRMSRQRLAEERTLGVEQARRDRARRVAEDASLRQFRDRMTFQNRMIRQQAAMERDAERARASAMRETIRLDNYRFGLRARHERELARDRARYGRDLRSAGRDAWSRGRDVGRDLVRIPAAAGAAATAAGIGTGRRAMRAESAIDAAEVNARIYADLSGDAARKLRDQWAAPLAESLGTGTDKMLSSYTEALKLGIPKVGAEKFAELATKTSEAWGVEFGAVVDILGTTNSLLTSDGSPFDFDKLKGVANTMQYLAAKQSTTPEKLMSYLQRGAGGAKVLGMSQEAGLAFGSASTSLGNQAGQSGRLMDYMASRIIELPKLTRGHGEQARDARRLVQSLGYGSAEALDRKRRQDPDAFLPEFVERFKRIKDPKQRDQAIRFFAGREWLGEFGRMVTGFETYREAVKLSKEAKGLDAISQVWDLHKLKLSFIMKQISTGFNNILGEAGKAFTPLARDVGDYFLAWSGQFRKDEGLAKRVSAALQGMIEGFGFTDIKDMLNGILGKPGEGNAGSIESWKATAKAFTGGISDIIGGIKSTFSAFTGGDPETMARWTGRILAFTTAMVLLGPVLGALGSLVSFVWAIGRAARALAGLTGLTGLAGRAGATSLLGGMSLAAIGGGIAAGFLAYIAKQFNVLQPGGKSVLGSIAEEFIPAPLRRWLDGDKAKGDSTGTGPGSAGTGRGSSGTTGTWDAPATVQKQSAAEDWRGLVHPASFNTASDVATSVDRLNGSVRDMAAHFEKIGLTSGGVMGGGRGSGSGSLGGGSGGGGGGLGRTFTPEGMGVPSWYGKGRGIGGLGGSGGGSATSNPANSVASAAMLDAIAGTESGKGGYDAVLGNGKYGMPSKPVSTMTLDEAFRFGRTVKARHGSSSALGRYQIVGNTMRAAQEAMGIPGTATFDQAMQDRMARWIARNQGLGAWEGLKGNPRAMAAARAALAQGGAKDNPGGGAVASIDPTMGVNVPGLGLGKGQYDGLRLKGDQARAGGGASLGVTDLARQAQENLPGGVKAFTAFNDRYHLGTRSKHAMGLAFDTTLNDAGLSRQAAEAMRAKLRAAGLQDSQFKVIDEYLNPSSRSTGGHIHTQFNDQAAAKQYHDFIGAQGSKALASVKALGEKAKAGEAVKLREGVTDVGSGIKGVPFGSRPSVDAAVNSVPAGIGRAGAGAGAGGGGGGGGSFTVHQTIHGAGESPEVLAAKAQRAFEKSARNHAYAPETV